MRRTKINRPTGFKGYYVEVPDGGDPLRAYRKMKKWIKNDRFIEEIKDRQYFRKPSAIKREYNKRRKQTIRKLQSKRDDERFLGRPRKH